MAMFSEDFELFAQIKKEENTARLDELCKKAKKLYELIDGYERNLRLFDRMHKDLLDAENKNIHFQRSLMVGGMRKTEEELEDLFTLMRELESY